jgi:hypothetical protein
MQGFYSYRTIKSSAFLIEQSPDGNLGSRPSIKVLDSVQSRLLQIKLKV